MTDRQAKIVARLSPEIQERLHNASLRAFNVANRLGRIEILGDEECATLEHHATRMETALTFVEHALTDTELFAGEHGK